MSNKISKIEWSCKYPYFKNNFKLYTFGMLIFSIFILYESFIYYANDLRVLVVIPLGLYGLYYVFRNLKRMIDKEEISIKDNNFIIKHNGKIKNIININNIIVSTHELIWKWNYDARKKFYYKDTKKEFYFYETKYIKKEDEKILSSIIYKRINDDSK